MLSEVCPGARPKRLGIPGQNPSAHRFIFFVVSYSHLRAALAFDAATVFISPSSHWRDFLQIACWPLSVQSSGCDARKLDALSDDLDEPTYASEKFYIRRVFVDYHARKIDGHIDGIRRQIGGQAVPNDAID